MNKASKSSTGRRGGVVVQRIEQPGAFLGLTHGAPTIIRFAPMHRGGGGNADAVYIYSWDAGAKLTDRCSLWALGTVIRRASRSRQTAGRCMLPKISAIPSPSST